MYNSGGGVHSEEIQSESWLTLLKIWIFQNLLIFMIHLEIQTFFSQCLQAWFLPSSYQSQTQTSYRIVLMKKKLFCSLVENSDNPKVVVFIVLSPYSKSSLKVITSLISFTKCSIENIQMSNVIMDLSAKIFTVNLSWESLLWSVWLRPRWKNSNL